MLPPFSFTLMPFTVVVAKSFLSAVVSAMLHACSQHLASWSQFISVRFPAFHLTQA
jgi:hypothetical protein